MSKNKDKKKEAVTIDIIRATIWDAPAIADMWRDMMKEITVPETELPLDGKESERFLENLVLKFKLPSQIIFVAKSNFRTIGFIMGYLHYYNFSKNLLGYTEYFFINKKFRSNGIADALIDTFYRDCEVKGAIASDFVTTRPDIWKRKGYKQIMSTFRRKKGE
tara:strand:- start:197 stop:685 length:489 start_codon:yes stop_codon:yes gene_type:complete